MSNLKSKLKRLGTYFRILRYSFYTVRFNFHYLTFKQAIKFPIIFYNAAEFSSMRGSVRILGEVKTGMVSIGMPNNPIFPRNSKFIWHNDGGECVFSSRVGFQQGIAIRIGANGKLSFYSNISIGPNCKLVCFEELTIYENVRFGWEVLIMDTDFHHTYNLLKDKVSFITKRIVIHENCWIGVRSILYKGTVLPKFTIVGANSVLNKKYSFPSFSLIAGSPPEIKVSSICRLLDDNVSEEEIELVKNQYQEYVKSYKNI